MKPFMKPSFLLVLFLGMFTITNFSQETSHYTCYRTHNKITANGLLDEPDWILADWSANFIDITGDPALNPALTTRVKMLWDDEFLYLGAELEEPHIWASIRGKDEVIFQDNDFEIFLDPDGNGQNYYEIEINALGTIWDLMLTRAYRASGKALNAWDLKKLKKGIHIRGSLNNPSNSDTSWTVEIAIPIVELIRGKNPANKPADGVQWRINFSRVEWKTEVRDSAYCKQTSTSNGKTLPEQNWVWSPMGEIDMHIPERWGYLEFSGENITSEPLPFKDDHQKKNFNIWVWMGAHPSWNATNWDSVLSGLKSAGISGLLCQSDSSALRLLLPLAQKHGINVEKWFVTLMNNDTTLIQRHSDWYVINRENKSSVTEPAYVGYYRFLCPANPEVRQYLKKKLDGYLEIPGLSGIHLDYIRFPDVILPEALWMKYGIVQDKEYAQYDYCYCKICRERFCLQYGRDPFMMNSPDQDPEWRKFRIEQVSSLVKELADYCKQKGKKLSAAIFPGPETAKKLVRQDWGQWPLDEAMPMLYQRFYNKNLDWIRIETAEGKNSIIQTVPLYSGLYIPALTPRDLYNAIGKSIEGGADGICLFDYESLTPAHIKTLKDIFRAISCY